MTDLHGNVFVEYCEKCKTEYERDYEVDAFSTDCYAERWYVKCGNCQHNHYTGRHCSEKGCRGKLRDTIVNFGERRWSSAFSLAHYSRCFFPTPPHSDPIPDPHLLLSFHIT